MVFCGEKAGVAPGEVGEAEVEKPVDVIERDAHFERGFGGSQTLPEGLLHDGECLQVEPAGSVRVEGLDCGFFFGFEAAA